MAHLADVDGAAPDVEADGALEGLAELEGVHPGGQVRRVCWREVRSRPQRNQL